NYQEVKAILGGEGTLTEEIETGKGIMIFFQVLFGIEVEIGLRKIIFYIKNYKFSLTACA
ncbi:hypothetical protein HGI32_14240, partial [Clostridium acetobutylicum]|nr:hypothetical protein [Clostridium acetobutylicum]